MKESARHLPENEECRKPKGHPSPRATSRLSHHQAPSIFGNINQESFVAVM
ncbi:hypothetical protein E2C01_068308 [Portunus trituberculatus]|uniref:Uncharacterized protein n=1 Tax=Portunus trituberculatus TaxID=210409 RepID=A0A5B7HVW2_PORTR|nr:hypothetical protein [Portunus trituberculatus]